MNTVESLRDAFAAAEAAAPNADGLLATVHRRARHARRVRLAVTAAVTALALVAAGTVAHGIAFRRSLPPAHWIPIPLLRYTDPGFPYTPTWAPGHYKVTTGRPGVVTAFGVDVEYLDFVPDNEYYSDATLVVATTEPRIDGHATPVMVGELPGRVFHGVSDPIGYGVHDGRVLVWQPTAGIWLILFDKNPREPAGRLVVEADLVVPRVLRSSTTFELSLIPQGMYVEQSNDTEMVLKSDDPAAGETITIGHHPNMSGLPLMTGPHGEAYSMVYRNQDGTVYMDLDQGEYVEVVISGPWRSDWASFVSGVHYFDDGEPGRPVPLS
jgi:hypothetical protein